MPVFPVSADKVQLTTAAVAGTDAFQNGTLVSTGSLARAALSGGTVTADGLLLTSAGQVVYVDATAGLPANTTYCNGVPVASTGELCISTNAMASYSNGVPMAANGAVAAVVTP